MSIDIEIVGLGLTFITPIYGGLWYLITQISINKTQIQNMQDDITELKHKISSCKTCVRGGSY